MKLYAVVATCGWIVICGWVATKLEGPDVSPSRESELAWECSCDTTVHGTSDFYTPLAGQPDGRALFNLHCASCHQMFVDACGPGFNGVRNRVPDERWLYKWIRDPQKLILSGDGYANAIYESWGRTDMPAFPKLTDPEIAAILDYIDPLPSGHGQPAVIVCQ